MTQTHLTLTGRRRWLQGAIVVLLGVVWAAPLPAVQAQLPERAIVYYNEACRACAAYIEGELLPLLQELGVQQVVKKDFINEPAHRAELVERSTKLGIPPQLQGHFTTFLGERIILQGHVPAGIIRDLARAPAEAFEKIVVLQDRMADMGEAVTQYQVWAFRGPVKTYPIDAPIAEYLTWLAQNRDALDSESADRPWDARTWLPLIVSTGLLDGINPCAFAVLLFFIAFLFTMHRARADVLKVGLTYIAMIYLTYLAIGLGILQAIVLTDTPHFMARAGSWLLIGLGLINVKDYFWYGRGLSLSPSGRLSEMSLTWLKRATIPATVVGGVLVGLCTFPCSGGVYVAVLGLLSAKATYWMGMGYLLLYNVMFVVPLAAILLAVGNRRAVGKLMRWEAQNKRALKLGLGVGMVALGAVILVWFV